MYDTSLFYLCCPFYLNDVPKIICDLSLCVSTMNAILFCRSYPDLSCFTQQLIFFSFVLVYFVVFIGSIAFLCYCHSFSH